MVRYYLAPSRHAISTTATPSPLYPVYACNLRYWPDRVRRSQSLRATRDRTVRPRDRTIPGPPTFFPSSTSLSSPLLLFSRCLAISIFDSSNILLFLVFCLSFQSTLLSSSVRPFFRSQPPLSPCYPSVQPLSPLSLAPSLPLPVPPTERLNH